MTTPRSLHRTLVTWLSKKTVTTQTIPGRPGSKVTSTIDVVPVDQASLKNQPLPLNKLLTAPVIIAALNYASLALVDICTRAIQPTFFSTPVELGGLGLPPHHIGKILSVYGILNGVLQIFFFAQTQARFGAKPVYMVGVASTLLVFVTFPVINAFARMGEGSEWLVWFAVGFQIIASVFINFSYGEPLLRLSLPYRRLTSLLVQAAYSFTLLRPHRTRLRWAPSMVSLS